MPRGAAAAEVTLARRGRPAGRAAEAIWATTIFHQTPLEVAQGDTCKAPNLAYPNAIT